MIDFSSVTVESCSFRWAQRNVPFSWRTWKRSSTHFDYVPFQRCFQTFSDLLIYRFYFSDTSRTSVRLRQMWARPEPGSASLWRRSCFPDTWSSCYQKTSWRSEQNYTLWKPQHLLPVLVLVTIHLPLTFFMFSYPDALFLCQCRNVCLTFN